MIEEHLYSIENTPMPEYPLRVSTRIAVILLKELSF